MKSLRQTLGAVGGGAGSEWKSPGMSTLILLIVFMVLGAVGLFLALPGGRADFRRVGLVALAAGGGVMIAVVARLAAGQAALGGFLGCALVALFAAVRVITHSRPVYSALYFVLLVVAVTGLLVLMQAEFLAAALVIIYAGAILVTYLFVIMLAQQAQQALYDVQSREPFLGSLAGFVLLTALAAQVFLAGGPPVPSTTAAAAGTVEAVGGRLLTQYVIAIQLAGLLLLAALVGAIAIARRKPTLPESEGDE